jgi:hypothetical protein
MLVRLIALFVLGVAAVGCSSTATLNRTQTSNTYPNKLKLKALVYVSPDLRNKKIVTTPSTTECGAWRAEIEAGQGFVSAVESGLSAALQSIETVEEPATPETARARGADIIVTVSQSNENANLTVNSGFMSNTINAQFQTSLILAFADKDGQSLYSYTANGSGFNNVSGSCNDVAEPLRLSMETALKQIADYIAQSTFGAAQMREFEQASSRR